MTNPNNRAIVLGQKSQITINNTEIIQRGLDLADTLQMAFPRFSLKGPPLCLGGFSTPALAIEFSEDHNQIAVGYGDSIIRLWNVQDGSLNSILNGHDSRVLSLAFIPNSNFLLSGSWDNTIRLWNLNTGETEKIFKKHTQAVHCVKISPDSQWIATASGDGKIIVWDIETGEIIHFLGGHRYSVNCIEFSPDGQFLVSGSIDGTWRLWKLDEERELISGETNKIPIYSLTLVDNGTRLVTAGKENILRIWDLYIGQESVIYYGHTAAVRCLSSTRGQFPVLLSGSEDGSLRLWNTRTGASANQQFHQTNWIYCAAMTLDCAEICAGGEDGVVRLWKLNIHDLNISN